ncbi:hypothetical protein MMC16_000420 [Acarospora aff. strigata]|nr:hypothetical protein [Acarospora aff. strigata]
MTVVDNDTFALPEVARSLSPYITTRQDALRIRRILTVYFTSFLTDRGVVKESTLCLMTSDKDAQSKEISPEVGGLYKEYFEELQANTIAKVKYRAAAFQSQDDVGSIPRIGMLSSNTSVSDMSEDSLMRTYLALLRQRRRYERLRVLQDYMHELTTKPAAKADYVDIGKIQLDELPMPPLHQMPAHITPSAQVSASGLSSYKVNELVLRLEKTLLRAKQNLENEQNLLADLKARQYSASGRIRSEGKTLSDRKSRVHALHRTRGELIEWIERELAKTDSTSDNVQYDEGTSHASQEITKDTQQHITDIEGYYTEYVMARKSCLAIVAEATSPAASQVSGRRPLSSPKNKLQLGTESGARCSGLLDSYARLLVPLSLHRPIAQQKSHIVSVLTREQEGSIRVLDRLADESNLLSTYPLLITDPRFQNIAAALGSKPSSLPNDEHSTGGSQMKTLEFSRRWAFAASAAKDLTNEFCDEKIVQGAEHTENARNVLSEVRGLLDQGLQPTGAEGEPKVEDGDIWVPSLSSQEQKDKNATKFGRTDSPKTIWYGLRGNIG